MIEVAWLNSAAQVTGARTSPRQQKTGMGPVIHLAASSRLCSYLSARKYCFINNKLDISWLDCKSAVDVDFLYN